MGFNSGFKGLKVFPLPDNGCACVRAVKEVCMLVTSIRNDENVLLIVLYYQYMSCWQNLIQVHTISRIHLCFRHDLMKWMIFCKTVHWRKVM